jgi:polyisoprenyl-phosphate glycosyltransferase
MGAIDCFVSVVAPIRNDASCVAGFIAETIALLRRNYTNYELVLVDDASDDGTVAIVTALLGDWECVRLVRLSRPFGLDTAVSAGLDTVIGDIVIVMLPQTDPIEMIPEIVEQTRHRGDVIFGTYPPRHGVNLPMRIGNALFYWYCRRVLRLKVPVNAAIFRGLSRQAVNALTQIRDRCRYLPVLCAQIGYESAAFTYTPVQRGDRRRGRSIRDAIGLGIDILTTTSSHPLRFVTWLGLLASLLNVLYALYVVGIYLFKPTVAEGWTTLSLQSGAMFFFVFLILTVLSEYVGHILVQSEARPLYYVLEERNSRVPLAGEHRLNVVMTSPAESAARLL